MAITTKIDFNLKGLEKLRRDGNAYRARVGILGSDAERQDPDTGINNAELGVVQMFGSITKNIPPRDFLFAPIQMHQRGIVKDMGSATVKKAVESGDFKHVYKLLGAAALKWVLHAFESGGDGQWPPHAPSTIRQYGAHALLILSGQLRRACTSDVVAKGKK